MRTSKTISISLPPNQLKQIERVAKRENRTMSELMREAFRRYVQPHSQPATLAEALELLREDSRQKGTNRIRQQQIDAEVDNYRRQQLRTKKLKHPA